MAIGDCPNPRENCWQPEGPFSDEDHIYWPAHVYKKLGWVATRFRNLPDNREQRCRCEHFERHSEPPPEIPSREFMLEAVKAAFQTGQIQLTRDQRRSLGL